MHSHTHRAGQPTPDAAQRQKCPKVKSALSALLGVMGSSTDNFAPSITACACGTPACQHCTHAPLQARKGLTLLNTPTLRPLSGFSSVSATWRGETGGRHTPAHCSGCCSSRTRTARTTQKGCSEAKRRDSRPTNTYGVLLARLHQDSSGALRAAAGCSAHLVQRGGGVLWQLHQHTRQAQWPGRCRSSSSSSFGNARQASGSCAGLARVAVCIVHVCHDCIEQGQVCCAVGDGPCHNQTAVAAAVGACRQHDVSAGGGSHDVCRQGVSRTAARDPS